MYTWKYRGKPKKLQSSLGEAKKGEIKVSQKSVGEFGTKFDQQSWVEQKEVNEIK